MGQNMPPVSAPNDPAAVTQGASLRALLALALPMVLTRSTQAVDGFADTYMVKDLGESAIAATATGSLNAFALIILPMGTVFIVQSFVAQRVGRGQRDQARRYAWYGLGIALFAGLLAAAFIPLIDPILGLAEYDPDVHAQMVGYLTIRMLSVAAVVGCEALGNFWGGLGNTWMQLVASMIQMVINVGFNYVFIEGRFGAPALGVDGAAWSSVVSTWAGLGFLAFAFWRGWGGAPRSTRRESRAARHGTEARATPSQGKHGPNELSFRELRRVVRFGLPNGVNWFLEFSAFQLFINGAFASLGTTTITAFNVVLAINSVSFLPAFGVASAGAILAGQSIGAGRRDLVWPHVRITLAVTMAWMCVIGLLYLVAPGALIASFAPEGQPADALVAAGTTMLIISAMWQLFDAIAMTLSETLRAAGDTAWTAGARIVLAWGLWTPATLVAIYGFDLGVVTAMVSLVVYLAVLAALFAWRFRSGAWRKIELIEPDLAAAA
jgi:MATE family multidrug resistance protein